MAAFPSYARLIIQGAGSQAAPIVARTDMERGVPRTRRIASDPLVTISASILFLSAADANAFEAWFYSPAGGAAGAAWFDWLDPRTRTTRSVRLVAGSMGPLVPLAGSFAVSQQTCALEYVLRTS